MANENLQKIKEIIIAKLGVEDSQITLQSKFINDLGADSLDTVELAMAFEEEFNIDIPDDETDALVTVKNAVDFINSNS